jgi:hypothetical protein
MKAHLFAAIGSSTKSRFFVYVEACKYSMYYYLYEYKKQQQMNGSHAVLFRFQAETTKGQLISKGLFDVIVATKKTTKLF